MNRRKGFLALLFALGALHWVLFLDSARHEAIGPSPQVQDWPKEFRYYTVLQQAVTEARVPYFLSKPITFSRKFLAIPEVSSSPQILLLRVLPVSSFVVLNTVLLYSCGFFGLLLLRGRYGLGPVPFTLLFLLFNFNGHITAHLAVGHSMWAGYFLLPFLFLLVLSVAEEGPSGAGPLKLAVLLFAILLQGSFHIFVWCLLFLLLYVAFNVDHWRGIFRAVFWTGGLSLFRLLPAVFVANRREQTFLTGFPSLTDLGAALLTIRDATYAKRGGFFGVVDWWEYDTYVGPAGLLWLLLCGIGLALRRERALAAGAERRLAGPMAVMALLSLGDAYLFLNVSGVPLLSAERVASRLLILPLGFLMVLSAVRLQRYLEDVGSRAMRWLGIAAVMATAVGLAAHSVTWKVSTLESLLPARRGTVDVEIADAPVERVPSDLAYVAIVRGSAVASLGILILLVGRLTGSTGFGWKRLMPPRRARRGS